MCCFNKHRNSPTSLLTVGSEGNFASIIQFKTVLNNKLCPSCESSETLWVFCFFWVNSTFLFLIKTPSLILTLMFPLMVSLPSLCAFSWSKLRPPTDPQPCLSFLLSLSRCFPSLKTWPLQWSGNTYITGLTVVKPVPQGAQSANDMC